MQMFDLFKRIAKKFRHEEEEWPIRGEPLQHTKKFVGMPYVVNNPNGRKLSAQDKVIVHPTEKSKSTKPFEATIVYKYINWVGGGCIEVCTDVVDGYSAVMNDYSFSRIEPIKKERNA